MKRSSNLKEERGSFHLERKSLTSCLIQQVGKSGVVKITHILLIWKLSWILRVSCRIEGRKRRVSSVLGYSLRKKALLLKICHIARQPVRSYRRGWLRSSALPLIVIIYSRKDRVLDLEALCIVVKAVFQVQRKLLLKEGRKIQVVFLKCLRK